MAEKIIAKVKEEHPKVRIDGVDSVSGKVSSELFDKGLFALIAAALGVAMYIWIRFEWQFGIGAIWALIHDTTLTFGLFSLTQMEFDLNTIAAMLDDHRLFAQRHDRDLRPYPRKYDEIPQNGYACFA
jgi:preprotein translocase subunit SecF